MLRRSTVILLLIFLLLAILMIVLQQGWFEKDEIQPTQTSQPVLLDGFPLENLQLITYSDNNQVILELTKNPAGNWSAVAPEGLLIDSGKMEQLLVALYSLTPAGTVSAGTALEALGISPESPKIILTNTSGEKWVLIMGNITPTSSGYFVQLNNDPAQVVSRYGFEDFRSLLQPDSIQAPTASP